MDIVDNAPEMDLTDPKFAEMLQGSKQPKEPAKVEEPKPDVKPKADVSSASEPEPEPDHEEAKEDEPEETPEKLKARIRGLQAELTRRKGNADKVNELELQLARVQGQLETINRGEKNKTIEAAVRELDDKALVSKKVDWDDELADARARYARAEELDDKSAMREQAGRIKYAKDVLAAIEFESADRRDRKQTEADAVKSEQTRLKSELEGMYSTLEENFPDFQDQTSDLWKAGDAEFRANPTMMKKLGPAGEVVAAALAVLKNPHLIGQRSEAEARREVVGKLEKGVKKALSTGAASPSTGRMVTPRVETGEGLAKFNELVDRIKGG